MVGEKYYRSRDIVAQTQAWVPVYHVMSLNELLLPRPKVRDVIHESSLTCCETETAPSLRNSFCRMLGAIKRLKIQKLN